MQLDIELPPAGSRDRTASLHRQLRTAILDGRLAAGTRLPTTRELAQTLAVSRNTVVNVYERLMSEGYVESRRRRGCFVGSLVPGRSKRALPPARGTERLSLPDAWRAVPAWSEEPLLPGPRHDFRVGLPDHSQLPWDTWRRLANRAQRDFARSPKAYTDPRGDAALREAIAGHVSFTRAVACTAEDVIVTSGARHALALLADALVTPGRTVVAVEDPGYSAARLSMALRGGLVHPVALDGEGLRVDQLPPRTGVICVTPSHQFPVGMPMSLNRRAQLLDFARRQRAVVIEDDYDAEFRYDRDPVGSLQGLAPDRVILAGSVSKALSPGLRLGWLVGPARIARTVAELRELTDLGAPTVEQHALAHLLASGGYDRHLRRVRRAYRGRRDALIEALATRLPALELHGIPAGLLAYAQLPTGTDDVAVAAAAADLGVGVLPVSPMRFAPGPPAIVLGFARHTPERLDDVAGRLAAIVGA